MKDEDDDSESLEETNEDDKIAYLTRKYQRILRDKKDYARKRDNNRKIKNRNEQGNTYTPTCFKCKK